MQIARAVEKSFPLRAAGLVLALAVSGPLAQAQPQQVPNMGQQITPLAPQGSFPAAVSAKRPSTALWRSSCG
jgi:hypothetical protein